MKLNKGDVQRLPSLNYKKNPPGSAVLSLFTPRGLQEAVSVCTVSQQGRARCSAVQHYGPCQTAQWGSEKHPAFPVWEQAAIAFLWPHKYCMHSQLRDITVSMHRVSLFYREVQHCWFPWAQAAESFSELLRIVTSDNSPEREELGLSGRFVTRFCPFSPGADMLKHGVNKSLVWYLNSL